MCLSPAREIACLAVNHYWFTHTATGGSGGGLSPPAKHVFIPTREIACPSVNHYWFNTHRHRRFGRGISPSPTVDRWDHCGGKLVRGHVAIHLFKYATWRSTVGAGFIPARKKKHLFPRKKTFIPPPEKNHCGIIPIPEHVSTLYWREEYIFHKAGCGPCGRPQARTGFNIGIVYVKLYVEWYIFLKAGAVPCGRPQARTALCARSNTW